MYWGRGYATEAFGAFLDLFWRLEERRNFKMLVAKIAPSNLASKKVIQNIGATEGERASSNHKDAKGQVMEFVCWNIQRPGLGEEEEEEEQKEGKEDRKG